MMKRAWGAYKQDAWGHNELMPRSRQGHSAGIFGRCEPLFYGFCHFILTHGSTRMGATIIDGLDTLIIMGLQDEANDAIEWIEKSLTFEQVGSVASSRARSCGSHQPSRSLKSTSASLAGCYLHMRLLVYDCI